MKLVKHLLFLPIFLTCLSAFSQDKQVVKLSLNEVENAMENDERMIVLQLSTDWCVYCKMQNRQLSKNTELTAFLKEKTYYINLDAETKDTLLFNKIVYSPSSYKNGLHDFTLAVSGEHQQPTFPMWVIFNKDHEIVYRQSGLVKTKDLAEVLKTFLSEE